MAHSAALLHSVLAHRGRLDVHVHYLHGRGFDPDAARNPGSYGLVGLRERATLIGALVGEVVQRAAHRAVEVRPVEEDARALDRARVDLVVLVDLGDALA